jgi:hypothetical protein
VHYKLKSFVHRVCCSEISGKTKLSKPQTIRKQSNWNILASKFTNRMHQPNDFPHKKWKFCCLRKRRKMKSDWRKENVISGGKEKLYGEEKAKQESDDDYEIK